MNLARIAAPLDTRCTQPLRRERRYRNILPKDTIQLRQALRWFRSGGADHSERRATSADPNRPIGRGDTDGTALPGLTVTASDGARAGVTCFGLMRRTVETLGRAGFFNGTGLHHPALRPGHSLPETSVMNATASGTCEPPPAGTGAARSTARYFTKNLPKSARIG